MIVVDFSIKQRLCNLMEWPPACDEKFIRYIIRMFKAGVLAEGELRVSEEGVVQGSMYKALHILSSRL